MNERRVTDAQILLALRAHLPERAEAGLHGRIATAIESSPQQRPWPSPFGAIVEADPADRRRNLLIAAVLLVALTLATAAVVGAVLEWQRPNPVPDLSLEPPDDLDAYMAAAYVGLLDLPPLKIVMADGDVFYHDGAGTIRHDRPAEGDNGVTWLYTRTRTVEVQRGARPVAWVVGPPSEVDPRVEIFRAGSCCGWDLTCQEGWTYVRLEYVLGRPTHHVACGLERWVDVALGIPLRSHAENWDPSVLSGKDDEQEVVELQVGPQPASLFAENPDGLPVMSADEFLCSVDPACTAPPAAASSRPIVAPPPAAGQHDQPADLAAFITDVRATYSHLPALEMVIDRYSDPPSGESRRRRLWDGAGRFREEGLLDGAWTVDWLLTGGHLYEWGDPGHDLGPVNGVSDTMYPLDWAFGLPAACATGWEHRGFDVVVGRPANHLVCGLDEFWIDGEWLLVVRVQHDPDPVGNRTSIDEVVEVKFARPPPEMFVLPTATVAPVVDAPGRSTIGLPFECRSRPSGCEPLPTGARPRIRFEPQRGARPIVRIRIDDPPPVDRSAGATMSHMDRVGVRELRREASAILRRVAAGETFEVTDRGRPVAVLLKSMPTGLARLEREGLLRRAEADLLDLAPVRLPTDAAMPSRLVSEGRAD